MQIPVEFSNTKPIGTYGIQFLDDVLMSVNQGELVLIGASTSCGKSTLAQIIAKDNAERGVKTALFSLENSKGDTIRKEIYKNYKFISRQYDLTFRKFNIMIHKGDYDVETYFQAKEMAEALMNNIRLLEKPQEGFTVTDLEREFQKAVTDDGCKMIIIDHVDYFDSEDENKSENKFLKELMQVVRGLLDLYKVPVIMFSQFKKTNDSKMKIPSLYEFYGSGEKTKIATTVIVIAPDYEANMNEPCSSYKNTFICIRKDRFGNSHLARCIFDLRVNDYLKDYQNGYVDFWGYNVKMDAKEAY
ncbi:MAG: replicative DNA helicase [Alphaproteobacteria bacterium ADurb.Bin438]|nr:MAG: replicative DNA helicase [Alphaproteobacteria bacterium ADurb.Bin438]